MTRFFMHVFIASLLMSCLIADEYKIKKGKDLLDKGSYDMAIETLEGINNLGHSGSEYLIEAYRLTGKYEKALKLAQSLADKKDKNAARALMLKGEILLDIARYEEAYECLMAAYIMDQEIIRLQVGLANYYFTVGKRDKAISLYSSVFDNYYPDEDYSAEDLVYIGIACRYYAMNSDDVDRSDTLKTVINAILSDTDYNNGAIQKDPYFFEAYVQTAEMFVDAFNHIDARTTIDDALKLNPQHPELLYAQALAFFQDYSRKPDVIPTLNHALQINPRYIDALIFTAIVHLLDEEYKIAYEKLEEVGKISPEHLDYLSWMAAYHYMRGEKDAYEKYEKQVLKINPSYGEFYYIIGQATSAKYQFAESAKLNKKAVELDPFLWHAYIELGHSLMRVGDEEEALKHFTKVQNEYNFHVQTHNMIMLLKKYSEFKTFQTENFKIRLHISEADVMFPILSVYLEDALAKLSKIYDFKPEGPILFELFPEQNDFSVRAIGLSMLPASGVCFGKVVAQVSPRAVPLNTMNWASVAWHEFTHVFTLQMTNFNVPRWFTEGLSEMSERDRNPAVLRKMDDHLLTAYHAGLMRGIADLNAGFTRPRYGLEVVVCYYQAGLICHYISKTFGFSAIKDMLRLYKEGKKDEQVIRQALGIEPEEFDKHFLAWLDENIFKKMNVLPPIPGSQIEDLKDRIMEDPEDMEAMEKLCIAYFKANKLRDAEINAGYLLALDPMNVSGYLVLGLTSYYQKNMERAVQFLTQAIELGSKDFHAHLTLGIIYYNQKNIKQAEKYFLLAKESYPSFVGQNNPYLLLANIYKATNQREKYLQEIEEFLNKQGDNFPMRIELADEYIKQGKFKTARKWLDEAQDIYPFDLDLQLKRVEVLTKLKDFKDAVVACNLALALKPEENVVDLHIKAAELCLKIGDKENAKQHAQDVLNLEPSNRKAQEILRKIKEK